MERRDRYDPEQERREAFNQDDSYGAYVTRYLISENVRRPSESESSDAISIISGILDPMLQDLTSIDIDKLKEYKNNASERYGYSLSAPLLSSLVIFDIAMELSNEATQEFKNRPTLSSIPTAYICEYDISAGIIHVTSAIQDAENVIRGTFDKEFADFYNSDDPLAVAISPSEQAEIFIEQKARTLKCSALLNEDPTGKSLIRYAVEEIENPQNDFTPSLREFMVVGARFAQRAYETIYPLAEKLK